MKKSLIKKMCKRTVAFLMVMVLFTMTAFGTLAGCKGKVDDTAATTAANGITRGEWVTMLGEAFQMKTYNSQEPYYTDVKSDSEIFPYVQSCYEWDVLSQGTSEFKPESTATWGFVVSTAVLATGIDYEKYGDDANQAILKCAAEQGIYTGDTSGDKLKTGIALEDANTIIQNAINAYISYKEDEHEYVEYVESVIDGKLEKMTVSQDGASCNVTENFGNKLSVGSVFIQPATTEYPTGRAVKVSAITKNSDGTYKVETSEPELNEVVKNIDLFDVVTMENVEFMPVDGVSVVTGETAQSDNKTYVNDNNKEATHSNLKYIQGDNIEASKTFKATASESLKLEVEFKDGKIDTKEFTYGFDGVKVEDFLFIDEIEIQNEFSEMLKGSYDQDKPEDPNDYVKVDDVKGFFSAIKGNINDSKSAVSTLVEQAKKENWTDSKLRKAILDKCKESGQLENKNEKKEGEKGYKITGTVEIKPEFTVGLETNGFSIKEFSAAINCGITNELKLEGKIAEFELTLGKFIIPLGSTGADIMVNLCLYVDITGEVSVKLEGGNVTKVSYSDGRCKTSSTNSISLSVEAKVEAEAGVKVPAIVRFLGLQIIDVTAKLYGLFELSAKVEVGYKDGIEEQTDTNNGKVSTALVKNFYLETQVKSVIYYPLLKVELGSEEKTLAYKIKISYTFDIIKKENAPCQFKLFDLTSKVDMYKVEIPIEFEHDEDRDAEKYFSFGEYMVTLDVGQTAKADSDPTKLPEDVKDKTITYKSSTPTVASVSSDGVVTALKEGVTTIEIKAGDKQLGSVQIIVSDPSKNSGWHSDYGFDSDVNKGTE